MRILVAVLSATVVLSCGRDEAAVDPAAHTPTRTPAPTARAPYAPMFAPTPATTRTPAERIATATSVALTREPFYASESCEAARGRLAGSDLVEVELQEQGHPSWEERFLAVDLVARAKLISSQPVITSRHREEDERYYPAIKMNFRVFEAFRGSVSLDFIVVWLVGWDYYGSYGDSNCVRPESIADLREELAYFDDSEAILLLKDIHHVEELKDIEARAVVDVHRGVTYYMSSLPGENYFLARLPSGLRPPNSLEDERWRWLPNYEGDSFYDKKPLRNGLESETRGTVTTQELREVGRKIEKLRSTHDLECVYEAYRRARNYDEDLEASMKGCARER